MKTSLLLIVLIVVNTTAIVSEPITNLISGLNTWWLIGLEFILIIGYFLNQEIKNLRTDIEIDCNNLKLYIIKGDKK